MAWRSELPTVNIINMTLKNKITLLKNLIETRQMTLKDLKFDVKKSLDTRCNKQRPFFKLCVISLSAAI